MHVTLDIQLGYARRLPLRARIAFGARRAHSLSATALARRRAGELLPGRG